MQRPQLFLIAILICHSAVSQRLAKTAYDNPLRSSIDSAIHVAAIQYLKDSSANGISIGFYYQGKARIYNYGEVKRGSKKLPTANNFYNLGSVAKAFTGLMLGKAIIDKKAKLTDDIRIYLPGAYPNLQHKGQPIQLVHLANHTSALPNRMHEFPAHELDSIAKLELDQQIAYINRYTADSLLADLHHLKPDTIPGARYKYNGNAVMLLIHILERIYQQPYEQLVTTFLKNEMNMYQTKVTLTAKEIAAMAQGYSRTGKPERYANFSGYFGGPSMNSTVNDMLKFIQANLEASTPAITLSHQLTFGSDSGFGIGLGWMINTNNRGWRYTYHDGQTRVGFSTRCVFYPAQKLGMIIVVNNLPDEGKLVEMETTIISYLP